MHLLSACRHCVNNTMWVSPKSSPQKPCVKERWPNESWLNAKIKLNSKRRLRVLGFILVPVFPLSIPARYNELSHSSPWWLMLVSAFHSEATAGLCSQWVSVSPTSSSAKGSEYQSRSTHTHTLLVRQAQRLTMLCFAFSFFLIHILTCALTLCPLRSDILSLLRTYNCYHEGKNFQLRTREVRQPADGPQKCTVYSCSAARVTGSGYRSRCSINVATRVNNTAGSEQMSTAAPGWIMKPDEAPSEAAVVVWFPIGPNGRPTTEPLQRFLWNRNGSGGYTCLRIHWPLSTMCPQFRCASLLRLHKSLDFGSRMVL